MAPESAQASGLDEFMSPRNFSGEKEENETPIKRHDRSPNHNMKKGETSLSEPVNKK